MSIWIDIGALDDLPFRGARCVQTPTGKVGVFPPWTTTSSRSATSAPTRAAR